MEEKEYLARMESLKEDAYNLGWLKRPPEKKVKFKLKEKIKVKRKQMAKIKWKKH